MKYDIRRLLDDADPVEVAEQIGIPMQKRGKTIKILCPGHIHHAGHYDCSFGSCQLTEHGYYCFAGQCTAGVTQMVMEQSEINGQPMTKAEALQFIAETTGHPEDYVIKDERNEKPKKNCPFAQEELELIGLSYRQPKTFVLDSKGKDMVFDLFQPKQLSNGEIKMSIEPVALKTSEQKPVALNDIFEKDEAAFYGILYANTQKQIEETSVAIEKIKSSPWILKSLPKADPKLFLNNLELRKMLLEELNEKIVSLYNIFLERSQQLCS